MVAFQYRMNLDTNYSNGAAPIMPKAKSKTKKTNKKATAKQTQQSLLTKKILLEEQVEFYKKHSKAKTLIIIFILLVLVLMWLYLSDYGNAWLGELRLLFFENGIVQASR